MVAILNPFKITSLLSAARDIDRSDSDEGGERGGRRRRGRRAEREEATREESGEDPECWWLTTYRVLTNTRVWWHGAGLFLLSRVVPIGCIHWQVNDNSPRQATPICNTPPVKSGGRGRNIIYWKQLSVSVFCGERLFCVRGGAVAASQHAPRYAISANRDERLHRIDMIAFFASAWFSSSPPLLARTLTTSMHLI